MEQLTKNMIFTGQCAGFSHDGSGVFRQDGRAVFVSGALPGETWAVRVTKVTSTAVWGRGEQLLSPSPVRTEPDCPAFGRCGGCDLMHMSYAAELDFKLDRVNSALRRIGGLDFEVPGILPADSPYAYRNKAVFAVGDGPNGPSAGFYRPRSHELIPARGCLIQSDAAGKCAAALEGWMRVRRVPAYNETDGSGVVRHLFVRTARDGGAQACVVCAREPGRVAESLAAALVGGCPELRGVLLCVNQRPGNAVLGGDFRTLWGNDTLTDTLCGLTFRLSPQAFFQINPPQAEKLYGLALDYASPAGGTVLDLYCGAGTISLCLARSAGHVIGAEIVPEAVENARENAKENGIANAEFITADAGQAAEELLRRGVKPLAVVVDPPRKGLSEDVITAIDGMSPERVVYVSCDPATLSRDLGRFKSLGWTPTRGMAVDMFPRTCHVETVVLLERETYPRQN